MCTDWWNYFYVPVGADFEKTGSKLIWNSETEEIIGDNAATALLDIPIGEK